MAIVVRKRIASKGPSIIRAVNVSTDKSKVSVVKESSSHKIWLIGIIVIALLAVAFLVLYPMLQEKGAVAGQAVSSNTEVGSSYVDEENVIIVPDTLTDLGLVVGEYYLFDGENLTNIRSLHEKTNQDYNQMTLSCNDFIYKDILIGIDHALLNSEYTRAQKITAIAQALDVYFVENDLK